MDRYLLGKKDVDGGVGECVELDVEPLGLPALAGEGRRDGLERLHEQYEHISNI